MPSVPKRVSTSQRLISHIDHALVPKPHPPIVFDAQILGKKTPQRGFGIYTTLFKKG